MEQSPPLVMYIGSNGSLPLQAHLEPGSNGPCLATLGNQSSYQQVLKMTGDTYTWLPFNLCHTRKKKNPGHNVQRV